MKQPYSGNAKPYVLALFSPADAERVTPVLEELDARGYDLCGQDGKVSAGRAKRACVVVVFLTERFAADEAARKQMYALLGAAATLFIANYYGKPSLPRQLADHTKMARFFVKMSEKRASQGQTDELLAVLAREELAENGNWCSYQRDNTPDISL